MIFASYNLNKIEEVKKILENDIKSLNDIPKKINITETGKTFQENAVIKAKTVFNITKIPTIADDSGLEIIALNNFPGVKTHRFISGSDSDRNKKILELMKNIKNRTCYFITSIAYYDGKKLKIYESRLKGNIAYKENQHNGFGFDSIFLYKGKYLSDMTILEKNKISPRRIALEQLKNNLKKNVDFHI